MNFKEFIRDNRLKQVTVANYLGITEASVSRICNGISFPSREHLNKLLNNDQGWDTYWLTEASSISATASGCGTNNASVNIGMNASLQRENEMLRQQLAEEKERSAKYWEMIQKLMR